MSRLNSRYDPFERIQARLRAQHDTPLRKECSWCHKQISAGREPTSHGICEACAKKFFPVPGL